MKKSLVKAISICAIILMLSSIPVYAASVTFTRKEVDSNTWTEIEDCRKTSNYDEIYVKITNIYKQDGSSSNYKKVKAQFKFYNSICTTKTSYTANLGVNCYALLKEQYAVSGYPITFYAMGNDPALDCQISGKFEVD